jgi:hypothetical protein
MNPEFFDKNEYFYYDDPENGEFHEVVPRKFIAFKGPWEDRYAPHMRVAWAWAWAHNLGQGFVMTCPRRSEKMERRREWLAEGGADDFILNCRVELQDGSYTLPPSDFIEVHRVRAIA